MAMEIYVCPEIPLHELVQECYTADDQDLLKGSVPQPVDWLRAWRHVKEGVSFRSSARLQLTGNFAEKGSTKSIDRRAVKALQDIIVEKKREKQNGIMCVLLLPWPFVWMIEDPGSF